MLINLTRGSGLVK